jgi:drug/metabolite transporter (DMT)-like permease
VITRSPDRPLLAFTWVLFSALSFASAASVTKAISGLIPHFEIVFFRCLVNFVLVLGVMCVASEDLFPPGKRILFLRGVAGFMGVAGLFYSLAYLPLPIAMMLAWSSPLFVILFSRLFMRETLPAGTPIYVGIAITGLVLTLLPGLGSSVTEHPLPLHAIVMGLCGAAGSGIAYIAVRVATARVGVNGIVLYFTGVATLISVPFAAANFVWPTPDQAGFLFAIGFLSGIGQYTMTQAYRYAPAGVVSTMNLMSAGFAAILGWLVFHESLAWSQWIGMMTLATAIGLMTLSSSKMAGRSNIPIEPLA